MKKRITALFLTTVMVLTACGGSSVSVTTASTTKQAVTQAPTTQSATTTAPTTQAVTQAPTTQAPTTKAPTTAAPTTQASGNILKPSKYKVGVDMKAGEYVLMNDKKRDSAYFSVCGDANGNDIIYNGNFSNDSIITVQEGDYVELNHCTAQPIEEVKELDTSGEGFFKVPTFLKAGEYKIEAISADREGYYCVYSDNRQQDIVSNDNFSGSTYVKVSDGQYLSLEHCKFSK